MRATGGIGRVGGLAMALGVGAAVATGAVGVSGVANAAPAGDSSSAVGSSDGAPSAGGARATSRDDGALRSGRKPAERQRRNDTPHAAAAVPGPRSPAVRVGVPSRPAVADAIPAADPVPPATPGASASRPAVPVPAPVPGQIAPPTIAVPAPAATLIAAPVAGTLRGLPAPFTSTGPGTPAGSTAAWVVLAAVRRSGRQQPAVPAAATVSTGQGVGAAVTARASASKFSNRTPTLSPTQLGQSPTGVISGALNAVDADGDPLTYSVGTNPAHGTVAVDSSGGFVYSPDKASAHNGVTDSFAVTVSDEGAGFHIHGFAGLLNLLTRGRLGNAGHAATRTVTVTVAPINAAPTATVSVGAPDAATGVVKGQILGADADGDPLSFNGSAPAKGAVVVGQDGSFSYTPTAAARHSAASPAATPADKADSFTVTVADGHGGSVTVPITVSIAPDNAPPTASRTVGTPNAITGVVAGAVVGSDPNGDPLSYSLFQAAAKGTVTISADGSFTYTPTAVARHVASLTNAPQSELTDSFTVRVDDGNGGTADVPVDVVVAPATITFTFAYGTGSQYWSDPARAALQSAAARLASYIVVNRPVTLTYDVSGESNPGTNLLATAYADFVSSSPGFYGTVVQTKVLTGSDSNGASADSQLSVNFAYPWALGNSVPNNQYDLQSVAMHELVHTLGFLSGLGDPSSINRNWTLYDKFLSTAAGVSPIGPDYVWNAVYTPNLTGGNGGLYFAGPNAEAAYGGPVPLYTPGTWGSGASLTHLDGARAPGGTTYLMDPFDGYGPGVRTLTPVEGGILTDLGYTVYQGPIYAIFFIGVRRRRRAR